MRFWKRRAAKKSPENAKKWGPALFLPHFFSRGILVMEILECVYVPIINHDFPPSIWSPASPLTAQEVRGLAG